MKKLTAGFLLVLISGCLNFALAQDANNPVLMTISGTPVTKSEFEKVYRKNNSKEGSYDMKDVREYLELYINYKLKVKEAEEEKLDTSATFINELKGYRKQLAQPYMTDKDVSDALIKEAYDRMQKDVRASHILINVAPDALPKDTLLAYNRSLKIREMLTKGADFEKVARDSSNDPSAKENNGDLGYFTGMQMVYPFETAAYTTKPGQLSMPVRTKFGYHIIKVIDIRDAQGEIKVAHIMIKSPANAPDSVAIQAKAKIDEIYAKLKGGEKFEDLATNYSDDKGSAKTGGALPPFGTGRMVPEFEKAAFALKNDGEFSAPVKTSYGWHIIKRLEKKPIPTFEEKKNELKNQVARDSRAEISKNSMIARIKKEYNFKEIIKNKDQFVSALDTSVLNGEWNPEKVKGMNKPLFSIGTQNYTQEDFAKYINNHQSKKQNTTAKQVGYSLYNQFVDESCLNYEESQLENKYPEFKSLMQEYRDGILLFDLTDKKVWSKAVKDSAGLVNFYETNKNNYKWDRRCDAIIYTCANADIASKTRKLLKKQKPLVEILTTINKDSQLNLNTKDGKFLKGENEIIDAITWQKGLSPDMNRNNSVVFVDVLNIIEPTPKTLDEAKGIITADYQNYLEKEWIKQLRAKYPVSVNQDVLNSLGK
ncbi:MAG TPA: peptidylprolyl isomerase [Bacteroidia bacterium]|nr:peptidylprolyl isomerase [Bacteroidia bacterium]